MDEFKTFYLAYAIDQNVEDPPERKLLDRVRAKLITDGFIIYEPKRAFHISSNSTNDEVEFSPISRFIYEVNSFALKRADLRIFVITDAPSWGVPVELIETINRSLPFVLINLTNKREIPHYLRVLLTEAKAIKLDDADGDAWFESLKSSLLSIVLLTTDYVPFTWFSEGRDK